MASPLLVAFDLDDTLAPSKTAIDPRIGNVLVDLAERTEVAIISGGRWEQFLTQVIEHLPARAAAVRTRLHMMPTCGTQYFRDHGTGFETVYADYLTDDEKNAALAAVEGEARRLGLWEENPAGPALEDRGSQITFSALGQQAALEDKRAWDPTGEKKSTLRDAVAALLPNLEVRSGGSTSIDITRVGIDKAYGMSRLHQATGIAYADMLFYGDRLDEDGNDFPVTTLGIPTVAVEGWEDTAARLEALVPTLAVRG